MKRSPIRLALFAAALAARAAFAYVDVELDGGHHMIGDSYVAQGDKLVIYRPSGAVEVDRAAVRSIQEHSGSAAGDVQSFSVPSKPAPSSPTSPKPRVAPPAPAKDPAERERELGRQLVTTRLDRLAAEQRGDEEAQKDLEKQIRTLTAERQANWKKLHPPDSENPSTDSEQ
jgi:hypothetical protein